MIGVIKKPNWKKPEINPNDYFDPETHIATEANFIAFLEAGGKYVSDMIGYKVQLSNTVYYNNGLWVIADVDHDSTNTGQSNCYDLISQDCFYNTRFGSYQNWRDSDPRTWLNNKFYPGFSTNFKSHILNPKYNSQGTWYTDDKVILPSFTEINGTTGTTMTNYDTEGTTYPIFTDNSSRTKKSFGSNYTDYWWTRSRMTGNSYVWIVCNDGTLSYTYYFNGMYMVPIIRVQ